MREQEQDTYTGEQGANQALQTAGGLAGKGAKKGGRKAGRTALNLARKGFSAAKTALKGIKLAGAVSAFLVLLLKILLILLIAMIIILVFMHVEKAYAFQGWGKFIESFTQASPTYKTRGYSTMGGLKEDEFFKLVGDIDNGIPGAIDTGELPIDKNLPKEEQEKLEKENAERQANFKEASTDQERERIKAYVKAERDSTLKSPEEEGFFSSMFNFFNTENDASEEDIKMPRLTFKNDQVDIDKMRQMVVIDYQHDSQEDIEWKERVRSQIYAIEGFKDNVWGQMKNPDTKPNNLKNITDKMIEGSGEVPTVKDYPLEDMFYKELERYALSWKSLYLIDKSLDENEFEDFKKFKDVNLSETDKEKLKDELKKRFILQGIPRFMPEFTAVRHFKWTEEKTSSTSYSKDKDGNCKSSSGSSRSLKVTPIYMLEEVNKWDQEIISPTAEKEIIKEEWNYSKNQCGDVYLSSYKYTRTVEPIPATATDIEPIYQEEKDNVYGEEKVVSRYRETVVNESKGTVEIIPKDGQIEKIFKDLYGEDGYEIIKFDIEQGVYLSQWAPEFQMARYEVGRAFGVDPNMLWVGSFGAGSFTADAQYIMDKLPNRPLSQVILENLSYINSECPKNGIPAPVVIGQMIEEAGWDLKYAQESKNLFGITGTGPAGKYGNFRRYNNYRECIDDYIKIITSEYQYAIQAGQGGPVAYIMALQARPDHRWCASPPGYEDRIINHMKDFHLISVESTAVIQGNVAWPAAGSKVISSPFGNRLHPIDGVVKFHDGVDIPAGQGTNIFAFADGEVVFAGPRGGYGNVVIIKHGSSGLSTMYCHIMNGGIGVTVGQQVKVGDVIAKVGSTGKSTGPHLHFTVLNNGTAVDPEQYLPKVYTVQ